MPNVLIAIDPSGNFTEGRGTTGIGVFLDGKLTYTEAISATEFANMESYWTAHTQQLLDAVRAFWNFDAEVVCESYRLQRTKAMSQSGSSLETPQLIGYLRMFCWEMEIPFTLQDPAIKTRFNDDVLVNTGVVEKKGRSYFRNGKPITLHERDAIRHGLYYLRYGKKD